MPDDLSDASPEERLLAGLFRGEQDSSGGPPDVEAFIRRHPGLEGEIRELDEVRHALDLSRGRGERPIPDRLGEFLVLRRLETGGMGDVYEARQEPLNRRVAIKVLRQGQHSASARERFLREQRVLARLHQTNIVPIHTAGREGSFEYFAMPFIDGAALRHVVHAAAEFSSSCPGTKTPSIADLIRRPIGEAPAARAPAGADMRPAAAATRQPARSPTFRPSQDYLRSVVRVMAEASEAVDHAHRQGVLHRDLKPSNIMVAPHATADGRRADQCWVIDFGLASYRSEVVRPQDGAGSGPGATRSPDAPATSGIMGTPSYMAPEQFDGRADERTDVWGLGVTLYELLTLRRAFAADEIADGSARVAAIEQRIRRVDPPRPRGLVPRDLEAICFRALRKDPAERYASARELAQDLRRWLRHEAVVAREHESPLLALPIRIGRWAQRNRAWAAALALGSAALAAAVLTAWLGAEARRRVAEQSYQLQQLELIAAPPRRPGWSDKARDLARKIPQQGVADRVRDTFAVTLAGLDARRAGTMPLRTSALAFGRTPDEVLLGGAPDVDGRAPLRAMSWDPRADPRELGLDSPGPVACRPDGARLQFIWAGEATFRVWDMDREASVADCVLPASLAGASGPVRNAAELPVLAMDAQARVVAAALEGPVDAGGLVVAWDGASGSPLVTIPMRASALAISADGRYLAAGEPTGRVGVWRLPSGERIADIRDARDEVQSLAFGVGARLSADDPRGDYQLAIGCPSGPILIWDAATSRVRATCRGMRYRVLALAFSPDSTLVAGAGAGVTLWDAATGECLLQFGGTVNNAVAFSADGLRLATAACAAYGSPGAIEVWDLQRDRGLRALRGLSGPVDVLAVSCDERRIAALSHDWRVAVWDEKGALLLDVPVSHGISPDNAGLVFSDDGGTLACVAGTEACCWDIATRRRTGLWALPPGGVDHAVFDEHGDLIVGRRETIESGAGPGSREHVAYRLRNLSAADPTRILCDIRDFEAKVTSAALDPWGRYVVVEGISETSGAAQRAISCFEIPSGRRLWSRPAFKGRDVSSLYLDPSGAFLSFSTRDGLERTLVAMPDGTPVPTSSWATMPGTNAEILLGSDAGGAPPECLSLTRRDGASPFLRLRRVQAEHAVPSLAGNLVAYPNEEGVPMVADLPAINERLADLGLGW